jgi:hypothetical protein
MSKSFIQYAAQYDPAIQGLARIIAGTSICMELLPVETVEGLVHRFGSLTYEGGVGTRALNAPFPATQGSTTSPGAERVIIAGAQAKTDVRLVKARPDEIARRQRALSRFVDAQILRGEGATNQQRLVGLNTALTGDQVIECGDNGEHLALWMFNALLDACEDQGAGRFVLMNRDSARQLKTELTTEAGGATVADFTGEIGKYEGVDLHVAGKDHDGDPLLDFNETQGTSDVTASMYCFAPGTDEAATGVKILLATNGIQLIEEGIRDSQHVDTIELAFGRAIYHPKAAARLKGIKHSLDVA